MARLSDEYWDCRSDRDRYEHTDIDSAVEDFLDNNTLEDLGTELTVYRFKPVSPSDTWVSSVKENVILVLQEELELELGDQNPDTDYIPYQLSRLIREMVSDLVVAALKEFPVLVLEQDGQETINIEAWIREHLPHWLRSAEVKDYLDRMHGCGIYASDEEDENCPSCVGTGIGDPHSESNCSACGGSGVRRTEPQEPG